MKNVSIDKCLGNECACTLGKAKRVRVLTDLKVESISISSRPPVFPGAEIQIVGTMGPPPEDLVNAIRRDVEYNRRRMRS